MAASGAMDSDSMGSDSSAMGSSDSMGSIASAVAVSTAAEPASAVSSAAPPQAARTRAAVMAMGARRRCFFMVDPFGFWSRALRAI